MSVLEYFAHKKSSELIDQTFEKSYLFEYSEFDGLGIFLLTLYFKSVSLKSMVCVNNGARNEEELAPHAKMEG